MTATLTPLEVIETPLAFHGGPDIALQRRRQLYADDIDTVAAHTARSEHGWHPICTLILFGGEHITVALDGTKLRTYATLRAQELAAAYQAYLPPDHEDDQDDEDHLEDEADQNDEETFLCAVHAVSDAGTSCVLARTDRQ